MRKLIGGLLLLASSISACKGPTGAEGPAGKDGKNGKDGAMGAMGLPGKDGADGHMGAMGLPGKDGAAGLSVKVSTLCQGNVTKGSNAVLAYGLRYSIVEYSNGDVWVACSVANGVTESSASDFYYTGQNGAKNHGCLVSSSDSASSAGFGFWDFQLGTG